MSGRKRKRFTSGSDVGIARTEQAQAEEEFKNLKIGNQSKYYEINSNIPIFVFIYIC